MLPKTGQESRLKPAAHIDIEGRIHRPVGTLGEMLQRAIEPRPKPLDWQHRQRLFATLRDDPHEFAYVLTPFLRGGEG